jgi:micrococcal nuclease
MQFAILVAMLLVLGLPLSTRAVDRHAVLLVDEGCNIRGKCVDVHDGDTLTVVVDTEQGRRQVKVRLNGIDAPELGQPFGTRARKELAGLAFGKDCAVTSLGGDRYGRTIGQVSVAGNDANAAMLEAGMAWHYAKYDDQQRLADLQSAAQGDRRGLWVDKSPIPPWGMEKNAEA